jgi:uncharacterized Zn finger protein (UPF0148 family)
MTEMKKFRITCPGCESEILVDAVSGQVLYHEEKKPLDEPAAKKSIQELMKEMDDKRKKTADRFEEEKEALKHRSEYLEKKFEEMKKHVDTADGAPPPHPFDYD